MIDILKDWMSLNCPECRFSNSVRLIDVTLNRRIICSGCHKYIYLSDNESSIYKADQKIRESIKKLEKEMAKISKNLKITF